VHLAYFLNPIVPFDTLSKRLTAAFVFSYSSYAPCLLTHPALLTENPAAVRAFLAASAEGWALACKDPAAAAADLVQLAKVIIPAHECIVVP